MGEENGRYFACEGQGLVRDELCAHQAATVAWFRHVGWRLVLRHCAGESRCHKLQRAPIMEGTCVFHQG
eukprot:8052521-Alexandrium_andersonii.AAC.1